MKIVSQVGLSSPRRHYLFNTWYMMNIRCVDTKYTYYKNYGARGITVCTEWSKDNYYGFYNFLNDMGERPEDHTLDRINGNNDYYKDNCRWATKKTQQNNITGNSRNTSGFMGVQKDGNTLRVSICLDNAPVTCGIFILEQKQQAQERYKLVKDYKIKFGDNLTKDYIKTLDKQTPKNKRFYSGKTSKYFGVCWSTEKQKWRTSVSYKEEGKSRVLTKYLGYHDNEDYAGKLVQDFLNSLK